MVLVRMVPVLVHARKCTFFMTETTISNTICWLFEKVRFWPRRPACAGLVVSEGWQGGGQEHQLPDAEEGSQVYLYWET